MLCVLLDVRGFEWVFMKFFVVSTFFFLYFCFVLLFCFFVFFQGVCSCFFIIIFFSLFLFVLF